MSSLELLNHAKVSEKQASISGVEMFGIVNKQGRMIDYWGKIPPSMTKDRKDIFLMQTVLQCTMQRDYSNEFGGVESCTIRRQNHKIIYFPLTSDKTALIIANKTAKDIIMINKVRRFCSQTIQKTEV